MKQGDKVRWIDGAGFENTGTVAWFEDDFMIPVETKDGRIIRIQYKDLHYVIKYQEEDNG